MPEPLVCCVMLTRDRPAMAARAVRCFREQTYANKRLLIWDSSPELICFHEEDDAQIFEVPAPCHQMMSIGALRNAAASFWTEFPIIIHWDDDDISHPNRIAEQVSLLQASGAECVGYSEMLFARVETCAIHNADGDERGEFQNVEAWLYTAPPGSAPGTSLCYWRSTWERRAFPDVNVGEDHEWLKRIELARASGFGSAVQPADHTPRLIATIHGGNTSSRVDPASPNWRRVPELDSYCRERCAL